MKRKNNLHPLLANILKFIFLLITFYFYSYTILLLVIFLLELFNVTFSNLNTTLKLIIYALIDVSYIGIYFLLYKTYLIKCAKDFKGNFEKYMDIGVRWWLVGFTIMGISNLLISLFTPEDLSENEETVRTLIETLPIYMMFSISIYAPIIEELLFRQSIFDIIDNTKIPFKNIIYVIASGVTFGFLHIISSLDSAYGLLHLIPYSAIGIAFAITYVKTKNIFVPMFFHFIHNSLAGLILIYSTYFQ